MSAPDTDLEKQQRRHRPALAGMGLAVILAAVLLALFVGWLFVGTDGPEGAATQVEPGLGAEPAD